MNYIELDKLNKVGTVTLIKDSESGKLFVRKVLKVYDYSVFVHLMNKRLPGIPIIYSLTETADGLVVIEDYINGTTLAKLLEEKGPPSFELTPKC